GIKTHPMSYAIADVGGKLTTFYRNSGGTLSSSADFVNEQTVAGSPMLAVRVPPAAIWDLSSKTIFVAIATASGELQIGEGKVRFNFPRGSGWTWSWTTIGRTAGAPAIA